MCDCVYCRNGLGPRPGCKEDNWSSGAYSGNPGLGWDLANGWDLDGSLREDLKRRECTCALKHPANLILNGTEISLPDDTGQFHQMWDCVRKCWIADYNRPVQYARVSVQCPLHDLSVKGRDDRDYRAGRKGPICHADNVKLGKGNCVPWNPRKVLESLFGRKTEAAFGACQNWPVREAVSRACEWAVRYHNGPKLLGKGKNARPNPAYQQMRYGQSVSLKPPRYIRTSVANAIQKGSRDEDMDDWIFQKTGQECKACKGRGHDFQGPCEFCDGTGTISKRTQVRTFRAVYPMTEGRQWDDEGNEIDAEVLTPLNSPAYRPDAVIGDPERSVTEGPPLDPLERLSRLTSTLLFLVLRDNVTDPVAALGTWLVHAEHWSMTAAAEYITEQGHPITRQGLTKKVDAVLAYLLEPA